MPVNSMYLYTIFNFKGKIKGAEGAGVGGSRGWRLISTLNDRAIKIEKDYFETNLVKKKKGSFVNLFLHSTSPTARHSFVPLRLMLI